MGSPHWTTSLKHRLKQNHRLNHRRSQETKPRWRRPPVGSVADCFFFVKAHKQAQNEDFSEWLSSSKCLPSVSACRESSLMSRSFEQSGLEPILDLVTFYKSCCQGPSIHSSISSPTQQHVLAHVSALIFPILSPKNQHFIPSIHFIQTNKHCFTWSYNNFMVRYRGSLGNLWALVVLFSERYWFLLIIKTSTNILL